MDDKGDSIAGTVTDLADATPDEDVPLKEARPSAGERLSSLDFVRGIAVMGILWANIVAFGQPFSAYIFPGAFTVPHGESSNWLWALQLVLIDGKMRGLFTILFGAGLFLFMEKAWARGATRWLQGRRLLWLLMFGAVHFFLIWRGDILMTYAVCGLVAVLCLKWEAKTQLTIGILGYIVGGIMFLASTGLPYFVAETDLGETAIYSEMKQDLERDMNAELADGRQETAIISQGDYSEYVAHNLSAHWKTPFAFLFIGLLESVPLMLIGMALYRFGLFSGTMKRLIVMRWGWVGLITGAALTVPIAVWTLNNGITYWGSLAAFIGFTHLQRLPMVLGLLALLVLLSAHAGGWLGQRVIAAGRMAFSNYLGTSVMMVLIFHGWGGGLFGKLSRPELYLVVVAAWIVMLAWSKPWLDRFRYGPLEWLWRCLTYWRLFPLRR